MQSQSKERNVANKEVRCSGNGNNVAVHDRNGLRNDNTAMTTKEQYREVIRSGKKWDALRIFNRDKGLDAYYGLTEKERMEIDLLVDMAKESL